MFPYSCCYRSCRYERKLTKCPCGISVELFGICPRVRGLESGEVKRGGDHEGMGGQIGVRTKMESKEIP